MTPYILAWLTFSLMIFSSLQAWDMKNHIWPNHWVVRAFGSALGKFCEVQVWGKCAETVWEVVWKREKKNLKRMKRKWSELKREKQKRKKENVKEKRKWWSDWRICWNLDFALAFPIFSPLFPHFLWFLTLHPLSYISPLPWPLYKP